MKVALPALILGLTALCVTIPLYSPTPAAAQPATATSADASPDSVDTRAAALRKQLPFIGRGPVYNDIPFEYRLLNISGPKAEKIVEDFVNFGYSSYGKLYLTEKSQLPARLREPGDGCTTCAIEANRGLSLTQYFTFWLRGLSNKQRAEMTAAMEKV